MEGVAAKTSEAVALLAGLLSRRIEEAPFLPFPLKSRPFVQICSQVPKRHVQANDRCLQKVSNGLPNGRGCPFVVSSCTSFARRPDNSERTAPPGAPSSSHEERASIEQHRSLCTSAQSGLRFIARLHDTSHKLVLRPMHTWREAVLLKV